MTQQENEPLFDHEILYVLTAFVQMAYKQGHSSFTKEIQKDLEFYIEEANYPDDYNLKDIARDLRVTLELDDCVVSPL